MPSHKDTPWADIFAQVDKFNEETDKVNPTPLTHITYANQQPAPTSEGFYWAKRSWWEEIEPVNVCRTYHNSDLRVATLGHDFWFPLDEFTFFGKVTPLKESKFNG